jgi:RND superfamily putative drug exporter
VLRLIAARAHRAPLTILLPALVVVVTAAVIGHDAAGRLKAAGFADPHSQSARTTTQLRHALGYEAEPGMIVVARARGRISSPSAQRAVDRVRRRILRESGVGQVETASSPRPNRALLSRDGTSEILLVHFRSTDEAKYAPAIDRLRGHVREPGLRLRFGGFDVGFSDVNRVVREDVLRAELIAFPILALLLLVVFRGVIAAMLPLVVGAVSVAGTFFALRVLSEFINMSVFALNLTTALGLGLAVDYGLLMVTRYREELERHGRGGKALEVTMQTAGRTVLYSGLTVAAACAALLVFPQQFIYSMGASGVFTALFSAAAAFLIIPALLSLLGLRVNSLSFRRPPPPPRSGRWYRLARLVMRRPVPIALASGAVMLTAGIPFLDVKWTFIDASAVPRGLEVRRVAAVIHRDFTPNLDFPISIAVKNARAPQPGRPSAANARGQPPSAQLLRRRVLGLPGVGLVGPVVPTASGTALLQVLPRAPPLSPASQDLIKRLRQLHEPLIVGGRTADFIDLKASLRALLPAALALVAATTFVLLFSLTGSVVLPVKAVIMNALSLSATFGLLVLIFQKHVFGLEQLVGYDGPAAIETALSVVLAAVTFGLATDYSVLLLSRIQEEHEAGKSNEQAIALGMERTGRVITNAALLLAVAYLAFATSRVFIVKEVTVGQAIAVVIDASIVRALLVPSLMQIMGQVNWWAPAPLRRARAYARGLTAQARLQRAEAAKREPP